MRAFRLLVLLSLRTLRRTHWTRACQQDVADIAIFLSLKPGSPSLREGERENVSPLAQPGKGEVERGGQSLVEGEEEGTANSNVPNYEACNLLTGKIHSRNLLRKTSSILST